MSADHDLPPLSPNLRALVDAERTKVSAEPARAAAVLAATEGVIAASVAAASVAVVASAGVAAKAAASKGAITLSVAKVVAIVATAFVVGAGVGASIDRAVRPDPAPLSPAAPVAIAPTVIPVPTAPPVEAPVVTPSALPAATPVASDRVPAPASAASATRPRGDLAQEQAIIDAARAGLASGRNEDVLAAADRHAHSFPHGQLSEERDAMRILALARLGREPEAKRRLEQFRTAYPRSALLPKVEAALP